jgi:two-component system OmpR family response regulator
VVDDEPSLVDAVSMALRYEGFDVIEATSGRAGLALAQEGAVDLIVLDVMLPDLDGFTIASRLRGDGIATPVLFLTARDSIEDKAAGFEAGGDDYLTKPFSLAELVMRVRAIDLALRRPRARRRRPSGPAGRGRDPPHGHRVQPLAVLHAQSAAGVVQGADPRSRVALRLRR